MLRVTLTPGKVYELRAKSPVQLVSGRGTYGNGSIDWGPEGLTVAEILAQTGAAQGQRVLAALVDGQLVRKDAFITRDCQLEAVTAESAAGRAMLARTGMFLLAYGVSGLGKDYQRLGGQADAERFYYAVRPAGQGISAADLAAVQGRIDQALAEGWPITARKLPYQRAVRYFKEQGEDDILRRLAKADDGGAVSVQLMGDFCEPGEAQLVESMADMQPVQIMEAEDCGRFWRIWARLA